MALSKIDGTNFVDPTLPVASGGTGITSGFVNGLDGWSSSSGNILSADASKGIYLGTSSIDSDKLLDDYEEGTWTPTCIGSSTVGTVTMNGTYTRGLYTKIGRSVYVHCVVVWSSLTGTGNLTISGLPFTCKDIGSANYVPSSSVLFNGLTVSTGEIPVASALPSSTEIAMYETPTGGGGVGNVAVDAAGELYFNITYTTDA
jgi:hypothetical protein